MNGFFEFANRLADSLLWAIIPITLVSTVIGLLSWSRRDFGYKQDRPAFGSADYAHATWRMHTTAQGIVAMWLIWGIINAVPSPDYIYRDRIVVRKVNAAATYFEAFERCKSNMGDTFDTDERKFCDDRALVLTKPNAVLVRHDVRTQTVVRYRSDPYQSLYDRCMVGLGGKVYSDHESLEENIRDRQIMCHEHAMQVRREPLAN
jgi:hypothetical protein